MNPERPTAGRAELRKEKTMTTAATKKTICEGVLPSTWSDDQLGRTRQLTCVRVYAADYGYGTREYVSGYSYCEDERNGQTSIGPAHNAFDSGSPECVALYKKLLTADWGAS